MEAEEREKLIERSNALRQELKTWEREFAAANNGQKAAREDIKQNPEIAQKYKDYNSTRDILSGKLPLPSKSKSQSKPKPKLHAAEAAPSRPSKRKSPSNTLATPSKRRAIDLIETPSQRYSNPSTIDPYGSPSAIRNLFTPQKPVVIGPTPQKDGKLLGLFDVLPSGDEESPLKPPHASANAPTIHATPKKGQTAAHEILATPSGARHSRTPLSTSKRFLLDTFVTPLKLRRGSNDGSAKRISLTPSSASKLNLSTPSFLRRDNRIHTLAAIPETISDAMSPPAPRLPKRPLVRGLSSLLASLREMQEEALDDDLDALREMEGGPSPSMNPQQIQAHRPKPPKSIEQIQVEDSQQVADFPFIDFPDLDFNSNVKEDEPLGEKEQAIVDRDSKLPVYKKKGQKRTTRKVNMKPVRSKAPARKASPTNYSDDEEDEEHAWEKADGDQEISGESQDLVPDTQQGFDADSLPLYESKRNFDSESDGGTSYTASVGGTRYKRSKVKTAGRKTKAGAQVHMNYKRMKLRNTGAKGGKVGGRFSRRR